MRHDLSNERLLKQKQKILRGLSLILCLLSLSVITLSFSFEKRAIVEVETNYLKGPVINTSCLSLLVVTLCIFF